MAGTVKIAISVEKNYIIKLKSLLKMQITRSKLTNCT